MTVPDLVAPAPWRAEVARRIGWGLFHTAYAVHVSGRQHVPVSGACLVVSNHAGFADGTLVLSLAPRLVVDFGEPLQLSPPTGIPGRERLAAATRQVQQALSAHVAAAAVRHRDRLGREPA